MMNLDRGSVAPHNPKESMWKIDIRSPHCIPEELRPPHRDKDRKKWWSGLTQRQKRLAVAYDVLYQIHLGVFEPKNMIYFRANVKSGGSVLFADKNVDALRKQQITCQVCAIGSGVASALMLAGERPGKGGIDPGTLIGSSLPNHDKSSYCSEAQEVFSYDEWKAMERFFEGTVGDADVRSALDIAAKDPGMHYKDVGIRHQEDVKLKASEVLLRATFTSIIQTGGATVTRNTFRVRS